MTWTRELVNSFVGALDDMGVGRRLSPTSTLSG